MSFCQRRSSSSSFLSRKHSSAVTSSALHQLSVIYGERPKCQKIKRIFGIIFLALHIQTFFEEKKIICTPFQTIEISDINFRFPSIFRGQVLSRSSLCSRLSQSCEWTHCYFSHVSLCLCLKDLRETRLMVLQLFSLCTLDGFCIRCSEGLWEMRLNEEPITAADKEFI